MLVCAIPYWTGAAAPGHPEGVEVEEEGDLTTNNAVTVELLKSILEAFNRHDLDTIMNFMTQDCVLEMPRGSAPWGQRFEGSEAVRQALSGRFEGIPDVHYGEDSHWVSGDFGVSEWTLTGTRLNGDHIQVRGCDHFKFKGGKVIRKDSYWKIVE